MMRTMTGLNEMGQKLGCRGKREVRIQRTLQNNSVQPPQSLRRLPSTLEHDTSLHLLFGLSLLWVDCPTTGGSGLGFGYCMVLEICIIFRGRDQKVSWHGRGTVYLLSASGVLLL